MDYATLDHLSLFAEPNHSRLKQDLQTKGFIDQNGNPDINMINIRDDIFILKIALDGVSNIIGINFYNMIILFKIFIFFDGYFICSG